MYQQPPARRAPAPVTLTVIIVLAMLAVCIALSGCALLNPPSNLSDHDKRTMQIASIEEQRTIAVTAINELHATGVIPDSAGKPIADAANKSKQATDLAKLANASGDTKTFEEQLTIARDELQKILAARVEAERKKGGT